MKKSSKEREWKERPERTVGVDLGDRFSRYCVLNSEGEVIEEGRVRTNEEALRQHWEDEPVLRMVMETGTHSPWVSRLLKKFGHQVIVANARKVRAITENESKSDRRDAEMLARLGSCNPRLVAPIQHRSVERQRDLNLIRARDTFGIEHQKCTGSQKGLQRVRIEAWR